MLKLLSVCSECGEQFLNKEEIRTSCFECSPEVIEKPRKNKLSYEENLSKPKNKKKTSFSRRKIKDLGNVF